MSKICPKCRLISPDEAILCDCGFDFSKNKPMTQKQLSKYKINETIIIVIGIIFGLFTYGISIYLGNESPILIIIICTILYISRKIIKFIKRNKGG